MSVFGDILYELTTGHTDYTNCMCILNDRLYAHEYDERWLINISDPTDPDLITNPSSSINHSGLARPDLRDNDCILVVESTTDTFLIYDLSADALTLRDSISGMSSFGGPSLLGQYGNYAYLVPCRGAAGTNEYIVVVDITDVDDISFTQYRDTVNLNASYFLGTGKCSASGYLFVDDGYNLYVYDVITTPGSPAYSNKAAWAVQNQNYRGESAAVSDDDTTLYVVRSNGSARQIEIVDISDPTSISIGTPLTDSEILNCRRVQVVGDRLFVLVDNDSTSNRTVRVYDISTPSSPVLDEDYFDWGALRSGTWTTCRSFYVAQLASSAYVMCLGRFDGAADWGFAIVDIEPEGKYPSDALTRVGSLHHMYRPGQYLLEMNLGGISTDTTYTALAMRKNKVEQVIQEAIASITYGPGGEMEPHPPMTPEEAMDYYYGGRAGAEPRPSEEGTEGTRKPGYGKGKPPSGIPPTPPGMSDAAWRRLWERIGK